MSDIPGCGAVDCVNACDGEFTHETCPHAERASKYMWQVRDTCARAEKAEAALRNAQRYARSDGARTFDDCIRDLERIDDICRGALK